MSKIKSIPEALADLAKIHDERGKDYGEDYLHIGEVLLGHFPDGLTLKTKEDFNRFALLLYCVTKIGRYAQCLTQGRGHPDSLDDLSVYAQLLQRYDSVTSALRETTAVPNNFREPGEMDAEIGKLDSWVKNCRLDFEQNSTSSNKGVLRHALTELKRIIEEKIHMAPSWGASLTALDEWRKDLDREIRKLSQMEPDQCDGKVDGLGRRIVPREVKQ